MKDNALVHKLKTNLCEYRHLSSGEQLLLSEAGYHVIILSPKGVWEKRREVSRLASNNIYRLGEDYIGPPAPLLLFAPEELEEGVAYQPCDEKGARGCFNFGRHIGVFEKLSIEGWPSFKVGDGMSSTLNHKYFVKI